MKITYLQNSSHSTIPRKKPEMYKNNEINTWMKTLTDGCY